MTSTNNHDERIAKMTFASVYPHLSHKVEKKGRTKDELHQVIEWFTGFDEKQLQNVIDEKVTFETFFQKATVNTNAHLITGVICGYRVEDIKNPLTQKVRYLDKLVDELAKGKKDGKDFTDRHGNLIQLYLTNAEVGSHSISNYSSSHLEHYKMNILIIILIVLAGIIGLLLLIALLMKKEHFVKREIIIDAPRQKAFDFLKLLKNQDRFNKWAKADGNRKEETKGVDGMVGYVYRWSGDKSAGKGEKEIMNIVEGKRIETEIRFTKPIQTSATVVFETEALAEDQTKVSMSNGGTLNYPLNLMIPLAERNFAKDMDDSLLMLKGILEG